MINKVNQLLSTIVDDVTVLGHAVNRIFWEVAEEADHARSRLRTRRDLTRLTDRENTLHEQLGRVGFELLVDHVSVERTPDVGQLLNEIAQLRARREKLQQTLPRSDASSYPSFPSQRFSRLLETGEWVFATKRIPESSSWCGGPVPVDSPPGLCLAIRRGESLLPCSPSLNSRAGDYLVILAPATSVAEWDQWILTGPKGSDGGEET